MPERTFRIVAGLIALLFGFSTVVLGVKVADGFLRDDYDLNASFAAAGQGLIEDSDVKMHGVNIGRVAKVTLERGRAHVKMDIDDQYRVPEAARAIIRPKTLFGEKFVDIEPGPTETTGPFVRPGGELTDTLGGFELEKVLSDLYPVLQAVDPAELTVILDTLAAAGTGTGPDVNRAIANFTQVFDVQANRVAETDQFLRDLALVSEELARRGDDVVAAARDLNEALPTLNEREDDVASLLAQLGRLSSDAADILENNRPLLRKAVTEGGKALQVIHDTRGELPAFVVGLRQFIQTLAEVGRIPFGDGTNLAAIKFIVGEDCPNGRPCAGQSAAGRAGATAGAPGPGPAGGPPSILDDLPIPTSGAQAIVELLGGVVRR